MIAPTSQVSNLPESPALNVAEWGFKHSKKEGLRKQNWVSEQPQPTEDSGNFTKTKSQ